MRNYSIDDIGRFSAENARMIGNAFAFELGHLRISLLSWHRSHQTANCAYPDHEHPFLELSTMLQGEMTTVCEEVRVVNSAGDRKMLMVPPLLPHGRFFGQAESNVNDSMCLEINGIDDAGYSMCRRLIQAIVEKRFVCGMSGSLRNLAELYEANIFTELPDVPLCRSLIRAYLTEFFLSVFPETFRPVSRALPSHLSARESDRVETLKSLIQYSININADSSFFVKQMGMTLQHLNRIFKTATGKTINQYRIQRKTELARELLLTSKASIAEISRSLGFHTPELFTIFFTKHCGCSPRSFRQRHSSELRTPQ